MPRSTASKYKLCVNLKEKFKQIKHILGNMQICQEYQFYSEYRIFKYKRMKTYIRIPLEKMKHCPRITKALNANVS